MNRRRVAVALVLALVLTSLSASAAGRVTVKTATLAPDGSPWHKALRQMGSEWERRTDGRVRMRLYPGGVAGSDSDMLRKIRIHQLHASALTVTGLAEIDPAFNVFAIPLFFDSYEELAYVRDRLTPALKQRLEAKGFVLLHWGHGGWVRFFTKKPVRTVGEVKRLKTFTSASDDRMTRLWRRNGFNPRALAYTDILTGLQTGMIDALPTTPLAALSFQWYRHIPYMLDLNIAPLVGATVVSTKTWSSITEADRAAMLASGHEVAQRLAEEIPGKDEAAVEEMAKRGLTVVRAASADQERAWRSVAAAFADGMRAEMVPREIFDVALEYRDAFRADIGGGDHPAAEGGPPEQ